MTDPTPPTPVQQHLSITEVATATGLSKDTLRWYEHIGLIPAVPRNPVGVRTYDPATVRMIELIVRLRRTGMSVAEMRTFVDAIDEGAASHGRRRTLLSAHRHRIDAQLAQLRSDRDALDAKIAHYDALIDAQHDCLGNPITDPAILHAQAQHTDAP